MYHVSTVDCICMFTGLYLILDFSSLSFSPTSISRPSPHPTQMRGVLEGCRIPYWHVMFIVAFGLWLCLVGTTEQLCRACSFGDFVPPAEAFEGWTGGLAILNLCC